jgi:hypothetical protein
MLTIVHQGFVVAGVVALIVLACFHQETKAGVWRVCFGLGIVVSNHSLVADDLSPLTRKVTAFGLLFPTPHGQFNAVSQACHQT